MTTEDKVFLKHFMGTCEVRDGDTDSFDSRLAFTSGLCQNLALAIHQETGTDLYMLIEEELTSEECIQFFKEDKTFMPSLSPIHFVVESPRYPGEFLDIYGLRSAEETISVWKEFKTLYPSDQSGYARDIHMVKVTPDMVEHMIQFPTPPLDAFVSKVLKMDAERSAPHDQNIDILFSGTS